MDPETVIMFIFKLIENTKKIEKGSSAYVLLSTRRVTIINVEAKPGEHKGFDIPLVLTYNE